MKSVKIILITVALLLHGCATTQTSGTANQVTSDNPTTCDFNAIQGIEFIFQEKSESLERYGYMAWKKSPDTVGEKLSYKKYSSKRGKVKEQTIPGKYNSKWFVATTENCEIIYSSAYSSNGEKPVAELERHTGIYFIETLNKANLLVGSHIWTNVPFGVKKSRVLFTPDPNIIYKKENLQKLKVIGIDTMKYGHTFGAKPFSLVIETQNGDKALLPYGSKYFHNTNPISSDWSDAVVELIKNQKVQRNMTIDQVLLSWGKPQKNNLSSGSYGVHEQWVYGNGQYLYFENGILTSFQTSN